MSLRYAFLLLEEHPWGREMLRALLERGYEPELIIQEISDVAEARTREIPGATGWASDRAPRVVEQARERVMPVWYVSNHNNDFCGELLAADPPDLLVLGGTRIIRETILDVPRIATVNAHPGAAANAARLVIRGLGAAKRPAPGRQHALRRHAHRRGRSSSCATSCPSTTATPTKASTRGWQRWPAS